MTAKMTISILTIFPDMVKEIMSYGVIGQAIKKDLIRINPVDLRDFTFDKHRSVDGRPFGGGPGMVGRIDVIDMALQSLDKGEALNTVSRVGRPGTGLSEAPIQISELNKNGTDGASVPSKQHSIGFARSKVILLSPQGKLFNQKIAEEYSKLDHLILICGRYEGVDERVAEHLADEELSIGNYILSGGEIPAMVVADSVARLIPGVLGKTESLKSETFCQKARIRRQESKNEIIFDYPVYTEPVEYKGWKVPEILRSGDHTRINNWREKQAEIKVKRQRLET